MDRVKDPADPARCQGRTPEGQCWYKAHECRMHNGANLAAEEDLRQYRLTLVRHREQLDLLKTGDPLYVLSEALAMVHMLVEKRMNLAGKSPELFRDHGIINTLHRTIARLSKSLTIIEERLKTLKGKSVVYQTGQLLVQVCDEQLSDKQIVRSIQLRIARIIYGASNASIDAEKTAAVPPQGWRPEPGLTMFNLNDPVDRDRLAKLSRSPELKRLAESIGLQVIIIEELWNGCKDDLELVQSASDINAHVRTLLDLVKDAHDIEETLGNLLSQETRQQLGLKISDILIDELQHLQGYETIIESIWTKYEIGARHLQAEQRRLPSG